MEVNILQYGVIGAFIFVVIIFLKNITAERQDRRRERETFVQIITNHIEHDRTAKEELSEAIVGLSRCLEERPCIAARPKEKRVGAAELGGRVI